MYRISATLALALALCGEASAQTADVQPATVQPAPARAAARTAAAPTTITPSAKPTQREVAFRNGPIELHGTLMLPAGAGPFPAIVFLHGSGPHPRAGFEPYATEFARIGVASLFFDKRGSGTSGGSWTTSSLDDLAGDALAAVGHLKSVAKVDAKRIGFWGVSQAGWVAPLAMSRSTDIAFLILTSGGATTPRESEMFGYMQKIKQAALTPADSLRAVEIIETYFEYLSTGRGRNEIVASANGIRGGSLRPLADGIDRVLPSEQNQPNWSWVATYDPAPHIAQIKCPVLLLFGDRDTSQPTDVAVKKWREGLARAANSRVTVMVFPGADHGIRVQGEPSGEHGPRPFADGYAEVQLGWVLRNVVAPAPTAP